MALIYQLLLLSIFGVLQSIAARCYPWAYQEGLGMNKTGEDRICADRNSTHVVVEKCEPEGYSCNVDPVFYQTQYCTKSGPLPWKINLAPNDVCESDDQCYSGRCEKFDDTRKVCQGKEVNETCQIDIDCHSGLYCSRESQTWRREQFFRQNCTSTLRCGFGQACINSKCEIFGSFFPGKNFTVQDEEIIPDQSVDNSWYASFVCRSFVAIKTYTTSEEGLPLYTCIDGYEKEFEDYARNGTDICRYSFNSGNGTVLQNYTIEQPICGYNNDIRPFCPMRRSEKEMGNENFQDSRTWLLAVNLCHHRSSITFCRGVQERDVLKEGFNRVLLNTWKTTGHNYPLIANGDRWVLKSILATQNYIHLTESPQKLASFLKSRFENPSEDLIC